MKISGEQPAFGSHGDFVQVFKLNRLSKFHLQSVGNMAHFLKTVHDYDHDHVNHHENTAGCGVRTIVMPQKLGAVR